MTRTLKALRLVPDPQSTSGERLILAPASSPFNYARLTELHYALRFADEAVQMARGMPRFAEFADMAAGRDEAVSEALTKLREVLGDA